MGRRALPVAHGRRRFNPKKLERELHREFVTPKSLHEVIRKHSRLQSNGTPVRCFPSKIERDPARLHSVGKIIFDSIDQARACALELVRRFSDAETTYAYPCNRSRRGHVHMTRQKTNWVLVEVTADGTARTHRPTNGGC